MLPATLLLALATILPAPDFSNEVTPDFRGWESTDFAGWRDWSGLQANALVALPDDAATTSSQFAITSPFGEFEVNSAGDLCNPLGFGFRLNYNTQGAGRIHEIVVQISSPDAQIMDVAIEYSAVPPDNDFAVPSESYDLSPTERVHRFLISSTGLGIGTLGDISSFLMHIDGPAPQDCLDAVLIDVRYALEGEFASAGCPSPQPNSVGVLAACEAAGSSLAADNLFQLTASGIPPGEFGYFIGSETFGWIPCTGCPTQGELCLGGMIARFLPPQAAGDSFSFQRTVDLSAIPLTPPVAVISGSTWHFQAWYRDQNPMPTTNFTLPVSVLFQ